MTVATMRNAAVELVRSTTIASEFYDAEPVANVEEGFVNGGSIVAFGPGVSRQNKKDVLNSTLFAQRAADYRHERETEPDRWYDLYVDVLGTVGWRVDGFQFTQFASQTNEFTVEEVVTSVIQALGDSAGLDRVTRSIRALAALGGEDGRIQLFNKNSRAQFRGAFQIGTATENEGVVTMSLGTFYFTHDADVTNLVLFRFGRDSTAFYAGAQQATLNSDVYAAVREAIVEKLTKELPDSLAKFPI